MQLFFLQSWIKSKIATQNTSVPWLPSCHLKLVHQTFSSVEVSSVTRVTRRYSTGFVWLYQIKIQGQIFHFFKDWKAQPYSVEYTFAHYTKHTSLLEKIDMLHRNCMRQATPHVISRFENKAANTHEGGDFSENCQLCPNTYFVFFTYAAILISMTNTFLDWFKQFWVMYYFRNSRTF